MNVFEFMREFPDEDSAIKYLEEKRWGESGVCCPHCGSIKVSRKNKNEIKSGWNCLDCRSTFTVKSQTVFHKTKIPLQKWRLAISIITNAKKGVSSHQLARDLDMNQKSAWYLEMQIRKAMDNKECELLSVVVEADETYVGGKPRKGRDKNAKRGRGTKKAPVVGIVERGGRVIARFMPKINGENLFNFIIGSIKPDESILMTDEYVGYNDLDGAVPRGVVNHSENYVDDDGVT